MPSAHQPPRPQSAPGTLPFHEPHRTDCPWCGSARIRTRLRAPDPTSRTPALFTLDECRDCGHTFQNPRLTEEGRALHHRDRRTHPEAGHALAVRAHRRHRAVVRALLPHVREPESWLDVGTGRGRLPEAAREFHPYTAFDGLDTGPRVEHARAAGRIEEAHWGTLADPGTAARLRGRYDVVSMFHHLQHAPDPRAELRGAVAALRPGGHLLVETPDPACTFARLLGRRWAAYDQPRHLHLVPQANLRRELEALGCTVVTADRGAPHVPYDLTGALSSALRRSRGGTVLTRVCAPLLVAAAVLDVVLAPLLRRTRFSNAYRIVARKEPAPAPVQPAPAPVPLPPSAPPLPAKPPRPAPTDTAAPAPASGRAEDEREGEGRRGQGGDGEGRQVENRQDGGGPAEGAVTPAG